jgi:hypothetical protein
MFRTFDFASPDTHSPARFFTTVPQQALFMLNSPFIERVTKQVANRKDVVPIPVLEAKIDRLYRALFGRPAAPDEIADGVEFMTHEQTATADAGASSGKSLTPWEKYAQVLLLSNEFAFVD